MGFFGKIFQAMGFESNDASMKVVKKKEKTVSTKASYKLRKKEVVEKIDNIDGIKVYYPEVISEVKRLYEIFKNGDPIIINFDYTNEVETDKIKAYFMGICDASGVQFISISGERMYILLPEGVELES